MPRRQRYAALWLRAYSLGGSSFTGIEAIANNVNLLAEPRYTAGWTTLLSVALIFGFVAGGILLYTLSGVRLVYGQTLNAVAFGTVVDRLPIGSFARSAVLLVVLALKGAILCKHERLDASLK